MLTLEEVRRRLAEIPAEEFGDRHQNCAIGQIHYIITGEKATSFFENAYPSDVVRMVAEWNDNLDPEYRKALALMMPLPESFPKLTPAHALKLNAWAGEKALGYYDGPEREVLERAVALAKRAAAGEPHTEEEAKDARKGVVLTIELTKTQRWAAATIYSLTDFLAKRTYSHSLNIDPICYAAYTAFLAGAEWRPWVEDYLRLRMDKPAEER